MFTDPKRESWLVKLAPQVKAWREFLAFDPRAKATIDFETRSASPLIKVGAWIYSKHETTRAMCLAWKLPTQMEGTKRRGLWHMGHEQHLISQSPDPEDLFAFILAGGLVEAHNAFFERCIWLHQMVAKHNWPKIGHTQWRCSAAKCSAASLPRSLDEAIKALKLAVQKDMVGNALMKKMCKPRKPLKAERIAWKAEHGDTEMPLLWHENEEDILHLWAYCEQDVDAEEALSGAVRDLSDEELQVWLMDQFINERGTKFDIDLAESALYVAARWKERLNEELFQMTGVSAGTKRADIKKWLNEEEGVNIPDTKADTLQWYVDHEPVSGRAIRVMEIVMDVNRTSTAKYSAMILKADPEDHRIRDLLMYCGAGTGRWAGKGVQIHNFPARNLIVKNFDDAAECIKSRNVDWCQAMYGDVMKLLSHALRGAIIPDTGFEFMVSDYAAIEARVVLWLAGASGALDIFRSGGDIYCDMASGIYGYKVEKKTHKTERQFGKQAILGLGYGMGFITFLLTCRKYSIFFSRADVLRIMGQETLTKYEGWVRNYLKLDPPEYAPRTMTEKRKAAEAKRGASKIKRRLVEAREKPAEITHELALMKYVVDVYRDRYSEVKAMWADQEAAVIKAISFKGELVKCGKVSWIVENGFLYLILPSGRRVAYCDPELKPQRTSWGEVKNAARYMSVNGVTRKWTRTATYGGKLVENITQAVARDIMANAMMLAYEENKYLVVMSIHDELVAEVEIGKGDVQEFEDLMSNIPEWAAGCPIAAEGEVMARYKK